MKKKFTLKSSLFTLTYVSLLSIITSSCNDPKQKKTYAAFLSNSEKVQTLPQEDVKFLYDTYSLNLFNIKLAEEAVIRSTAAESTALAEAAVASAKKMNKAFANVAIQYDLTLSPDINSDQKETWKQLVKQKGWSFDKEYATVAENYVKSANTLFAKGTQSCKDKTLITLATQGIADLKKQSELSVAQIEKIKERTTNADEKQADKVASNDQD